MIPMPLKDDESVSVADATDEFKNQEFRRRLRCALLTIVAI